jgi:ATP-dependent Clp protease protease subunit
MIKSYLKGIVRQGVGKFGVGVELFRLSAATEEDIELTESEKEAVEDLGEEQDPQSVAILRVYEEIGENFWDGSGVSVKKFAEALDKLDEVEKLNIHINSLGGDTHSGQAIYNLIGDFKADTVSYIDGVAASAATVVACGADKVIMRENANYMIHNPWTLTMGNASDLRKAADALDQVTEPIIGVYKTQTGNKISRAKIIELMNNETWLTAKDALQFGFVNEVKGKVIPTASVSKSRLMINGRILNVARYGYHNIPSFPHVEPEKTMPLDVKPKIKLKVNKQEKEKQAMTIEELVEQDPELLGSIRANAAKDERERLTALNAMNAPGLESIIQKAIEDGSQPAHIAMQCFTIMKEINGSKDRINAQKRDATAAGTVPADDAPHNPPPKQNSVRAFKTIADAMSKDPVQQQRAKHNGRLMLQ